MIKSRHTPFYTWFFRVYTILMLRHHFHRVTLSNRFVDRGLPVLLIGNHFSWWDGFIANLINIKVFHRKFHVMMLEDQLSSRMFLNKAGAYSIKKNSRSVAESLNYTAGLLGHEENIAVLYPQGELESLYKYPVSFEKGISAIAAKVKNKFHLVFYVALLDYFSEKKPSLTIYLEEVPQELAYSPGNLEDAYNNFLSDCFKQQKE
jgi:hypothetical protein